MEAAKSDVIISVFRQSRRDTKVPFYQESLKPGTMDAEYYASMTLNFLSNTDVIAHAYVKSRSELEDARVVVWRDEKCYGRYLKEKASANYVNRRDDYNHAHGITSSLKFICVPESEWEARFLNELDDCRYPSYSS